MRQHNLAVISGKFSEVVMCKLSVICYLLACHTYCIFNRFFANGIQVYRVLALVYQKDTLGKFFCNKFCSLDFHIQLPGFFLVN